MQKGQFQQESAQFKILNCHLGLLPVVYIQWTLVIKSTDTVEPRYNEVLGTMKITLLYQVSVLYQGKKTKKYKELGPAKLPCYKRVLLYIRPLYNKVPLYNELSS